MNENSYFKDIIDVFLRAKKAEDIDINPHFKAATREMLSYKIDQLKAPKIKDPKGFWNKWKKTIIGVPASLLAVFVVVFALQNNQITVEKDDFSPSNTNILDEAEIMEGIMETPKIEDAEKPEERHVKIQPLVIDYSDTGNDNVVIPPTPQPVYKQTYVPTTGGPITSDTPVILDDPKPTKTVEPLPTPQPETYTEPTTAPVEYIDITEEPEPEPEVTTKILIEQVDEIPSQRVQEIIKDDILIETDEAVNHFREPISPVEPNFDKTVLEKLEITDSLSSVNVHYLNEDQVAVEVTDSNETRWYMFEEMNGEWAMTQKFD